MGQCLKDAWLQILQQAMWSWAGVQQTHALCGVGVRTMHRRTRRRRRRRR